MLLELRLPPSTTSLIARFMSVRECEVHVTDLSMVIRRQTCEQMALADSIGMLADLREACELAEIEPPEVFALTNLGELFEPAPDNVVAIADRRRPNKTAPTRLQPLGA